MSALFLEGPAGRLEALMDAPKGAPRASVLVAPPHPRLGGTLHTRVVFEMAKAFTRIGCLALRFNFRGAGLSDGTFDNGRGEALDFRA